MKYTSRQIAFHALCVFRGCWGFGDVNLFCLLAHCVANKDVSRLLMITNGTEAEKSFMF